MADDALTLIRAKITDLEEKLADLRIAERELGKLTGVTTHKEATPAPAKRSPKPKPVRAKTKSAEAAEATEEGPTSITGTIQAFLASNGPSSVRTIASSTGLEGRAISFALQALKRSGRAKMKGGEWSMKGRQK